MENDPYIVGLTKRIAESGLSKSRICREADIAYTTLDRILKGQVSPTLKTQRAIEAVLDSSGSAS